MSVDISTQLDTSRLDRGIETLDRTSPEVMADSISDVLKMEMANTKSFIDSKMPSTQKRMGKIVGDSLTVQRELGKGEAKVSFGSAPLDDGGVSSKNGGKIAQYLQTGVPKFEYGFTFKNVTNTQYYGGGAGFINARTPSRSLHPGFKGLDWIGETRDRSVGQIEMALVSGFNNAIGG